MVWNKANGVGMIVLGVRAARAATARKRRARRAKCGVDCGRPRVQNSLAAPGPASMARSMDSGPRFGSRRALDVVREPRNRSRVPKGSPSAWPPCP